MTKKEIDTEISRLQALRRDLEEKEREEHREKSRKFVGKCYKSNSGNVAKIIGIPQTIHHMTHVEYNKYQFPAVFLNFTDIPREHCVRCELDCFTPLYCDTIYFNIEKGHPGSILLSKEDWWEEITPEEFDAEFDRCIKHFKEQIKV